MVFIQPHRWAGHAGAPWWQKKKVDNFFVHQTDDFVSSVRKKKCKKKKVLCCAPPLVWTCCGAITCWGCCPIMPWGCAIPCPMPWAMPCWAMPCAIMSAKGLPPSPSRSSEALLDECCCKMKIHKNYEIIIKIINYEINIKMINYEHLFKIMKKHLWNVFFTNGQRSSDALPKECRCNAKKQASTLNYV